MSVYRDKKRGRFVFEFSRYIGGKRVRTRKLLPKAWTQAQADKFDREHSAKLYAVANRVDEQEFTIDQAVAVYLENHTQLKSFENIEQELLGMRDFYDRRPLGDLAGVCKEYTKQATRLDGKPLSPATKRNRIRYLTSACRYAWKEHGMGSHDPAERVTVPAVNNSRQHYATRAEMLAIARACTNRNARMAIRIAFYSGMRLGEILRAVVRGNCWVLADTKNSNPRVVPIHPKVAVCARRFKPGPKITIQRNWEKARARAGFDHLRFHDLRHSAASELIAQDVDLYTVGRILGHKDSRSTARYSHLAVGKLAEAVGRMGKKLPTSFEKQAK
jgi:integrase